MTALTRVSLYGLTLNSVHCTMVCGTPRSMHHSCKFYYVLRKESLGNATSLLSLFTTHDKDFELEEGGKRARIHED